MDGSLEISRHVLVQQEAAATGVLPTLANLRNREYSVAADVGVGHGGPIAGRPDVGRIGDWVSRARCIVEAIPTGTRNTLAQIIMIDPELIRERRWANCH